MLKLFESKVTLSYQSLNSKHGQQQVIPRERTVVIHAISLDPLQRRPSQTSDLILQPRHEQRQTNKNTTNRETPIRDEQAMNMNEINSEEIKSWALAYKSYNDELVNHLPTIDF